MKPSTVHVVLLLTFMVLNMITYKFYIGKDVYEFAAESKLNAMEMCNRQVIDKLDLHLWHGLMPARMRFHISLVTFLIKEIK